jgi:geranyl-CoA carboxylase alpha subunit
MTGTPAGITRVLVANRGEIACRVIRTLRKMGLDSVAVYSDADARSPHVVLADRAVRIGPGPVGESYLNAGRVLDAARQTEAGAIHPGYGFLAENADFAAACESEGLVFVGPSPRAIRAMGNKAEAKRLMLAAGVPCVPGYNGDDQSDRALLANAEEIGFPIMVKAAAGGGGRGMRLVRDRVALADAIRIARSEARNAFGSGELILEKVIGDARHVEIQVIADKSNRTVHLGERDCSIQRRHQKVIEESPSPAMTPALREQMGAAAVRAARAIDYTGAGTVEFLLDRNGEFYFLEMNTRLQVEHPVTEMVTGLDLVELQIRIARGEPLRLDQAAVGLSGHAIEARLYTEDPALNFMPTTGEIELWKPATGDGVRVDAGVCSGQVIGPFYDALAAKVIAWGADREIARHRLIEALTDTTMFGPKTNKPFLMRCLKHPVFIKGEATTGFIEQDLSDGRADSGTSVVRALVLAAVLLFRIERDTALASAPGVSPTLLDWSSGIRLATRYQLETDGARHMVSVLPAGGAAYSVTVDGRSFATTVLSIDAAIASVSLDGEPASVRYLQTRKDAIWTSVDGADYCITRVARSQTGADEARDSGKVSAPMHGVVQTVAVSLGENVEKGHPLLVVEAMKMQQQIPAPLTGVITSIRTQPGQQVATGDILLTIEERAPEPGAPGR